MTRLRPRLRPPSPPPSVASFTSTVSFNAEINRLSSSRFHNAVLQTFSSMLKSNIPADAYTYPSLFKACTSLSLFSLGRSLHQRAVVSGYSSHPYVSSSLIAFYARFSRVTSARKVFDQIPERSVCVSPWNAIIGLYSSSGDHDSSFRMFNSMRNEGISPTSVTLLSLISRLNDPLQLECIHAVTVRSGLVSDLNLGNCMLHLYGLCGRAKAAGEFFNGMLQRDVVSWNSLVAAYSQTGDFQQILGVLKKMRVSGVKPDSQTFGTLLMSANTFRNGFDLKAIHGQIVSDGVMVDAPLATPLVGLYLRFGDFDSAFRVFERTLKPDAILWTSMISGLVQSDCGDKALMVFNKMLLSVASPSTATMAAVISACAEVGALRFGTAVHGYFLRQAVSVDTAVENSLITMYAKCGCLDKASSVFSDMRERDLVSWNAIVAGYAQNGKLYTALVLFDEMRIKRQKPDFVTVISLLQSCASLGAIQLGRLIHCFVTKGFLHPCTMTETALVDMYSKCGDLASARKCFDSMPQRDIVPWSTIIAGYGSHGRGEASLEIFSDFLNSGIRPNHVIFLSVLYACSHNGLVSEGLRLFRSMVEDFGINPRLEHNACVVDMLCRAGKVEDAYNFYKDAIFEPSIDVLGIILDACRAKGKTRIGEMVAKEIVSCKPVSAENYVQLAQGYASMDRWDGVGESWRKMKSLGLKKVPGWSYFEQNGNIETFFMGYGAHERNDEMMGMLEVLGFEMSRFRVELDVKGMQDTSCV